jgi:hypothetical protein
MRLECSDVARAALGEPAKNTGRELLYHCPRHDDQHPSLSVNPTKNVWMCGPCSNSGGAWKLAAFLAGVDPSDKIAVRAWLAEHNLLSRVRAKRAIEQTYDYTDEDGKLLFQIVRYGSPKSFAARRPDECGGWINNVRGVRLVPYQLPRLLSASEVFIPEGEKDCDRLISMSLVATTNPFGAGKWRAEYSLHFSGKSVCILPDNDDVGQRHAEDIARNLHAVAVTVKIVSLPGLAVSGDVSDWFAAGHSQNDLLDVVTRAPVWQPQIQTPEPESDLETLIGRLTATSTKQDRNCVLASIASELDPAERGRLLRRVSERTQIPMSDLRAAMKFASRVKRPESKPPEMNENERRDALTLLHDPELFRRFMDDSAALGIVGEEENRALLELAYVSRLDDDPVNANVKGESAAGKNHLVCSVARMQPPEAVKEITYASAKSLLYLAESLVHKILVIMEAPGAEEAQYSIRTMESEKKLKVLVAERGPDGRIETREHTVEGPVAVVQTTTKPHLHPENETRTFDIYINESEDQTKSILRQQARRAEQPEIVTRTSEIVHRWQNAHRMLRCHPVVVPFAGVLAEALAQRPSLLLRVRRDFVRILALIRASALLHQYQRDREVRDGAEYVVSTEEDYVIVRAVAGPALAQVWMEATPKCRELVEAASRLAGEAISTKKLMNALRWSAPTVRKYAKEAAHLGCLAPADVPGCWRFLGTVQEIRNPLPVPEEIFAAEHQLV